MTKAMRLRSGTRFVAGVAIAALALCNLPGCASSSPKTAAPRFFANPFRKVVNEPADSSAVGPGDGQDVDDESGASSEDETSTESAEAASEDSDSVDLPETEDIEVGVDAEEEGEELGSDSAPPDDFEPDEPDQDEPDQDNPDPDDPEEDER